MRPADFDLFAVVLRLPFQEREPDSLAALVVSTIRAPLPGEHVSPVVRGVHPQTLNLAGSDAPPGRFQFRDLHLKPALTFCAMLFRYGKPRNVWTAIFSGKRMSPRILLPTF